MSTRDAPSTPTERSFLELSAVELSAEERALLERARALRSGERMPDTVRERLLARLSDDARHGERHVAPARPLTVVPRPVPPPAVLLLAALAAAVLLFVGGRAGLDPSDTAAALGPEPRSKAASAATNAATERLFDLALFQSSAQVLPAGVPALTGTNLLSDAPFSEHGENWQVRRWDDLQSDPGEAAAHEFLGGALCMPLAPEARVLGGWPWLSDDGVPREKVALAAGRSYRLSLQAWVTKAAPVQLLVAVGHATLPFGATAGARVPVSTEPQRFVVDFVARQGEPNAGVAFLANGARGAEPVQLCLRELALSERPPTE